MSTPKPETLTITKDQIKDAVFELVYQRILMLQSRKRLGELTEVPDCWISRVYQGLEHIQDVTVTLMEDPERHTPPEPQEPQ